jgi:hypothetical protein
LFESWRASPCDYFQSFEWLFVQEWGLAFHHLHGHDPKTPDIDFEVVGLTFADFGCHPVWRADHRLEFLPIPLAEPKISCEMLAELHGFGLVGKRLTDFDGPITEEEDIIALYISIYNVLVVEILESLSNLLLSMTYPEVAESSVWTDWP